MLEIKRAAIGLEAEELLELERIVTDSDEKSALSFLKTTIYNRVAQSQRGQLKSHLDGSGDPVKKFVMDSGR